MTFLTRLPVELYPPDALGACVPGRFSLGTARAAAWFSQLAYEDEIDKIDAVLTLWAAQRIAAFDPPATSVLPITGTRGLVAETRGIGVLAFAGTDPLNLAHWLTDINFVQNQEGIHRGFDTALEAAWGDVTSALRGADPAAPLLVVGHSLGGALAVLAAHRIRTEFGLESEVYTFGMPRVGSPEFAAAYNAAAGERTYRLVHGEDVVPTVPPSELTFCHVGRFLPCPRHTRFDAAALRPAPTDEPAFVPGLLGGLKEGLRQLWSLSVAPAIRPDPIGQLSRILPPAFGDHLPDRYWMALDPAPAVGGDGSP
ncbi:MAG: lipase family protein [Rhodoplanes sp.]|uniref:lipase family protein n=1 Tax=Rhodoplanes sp. TaxID=1968906 RepID=UPI0017B62A77|nr:lipase family protein [Rhodoplanes sp.]NVO13537.1 lipase family protein [Rhodoplanes sp.]